MGVQERLFPEMDQGEAVAFAPRRSGASVEARWRCRVSSQGVYRISQATLVAAGIAPDEVIGSRLRLFNRDREVAVSVSTEARFSADDSLVFYGEGYAGLQSDENVYWLGLGGVGLRIAARNGRPIPGVPVETRYRETLVHDGDALYIAGYRSYDAELDHWFAKVIQHAADAPVPFATQDIAGDDPVNIYFRAGDRAAQSTYNPERTLDVRIQGQLVASPTYAGNGARFFSGTFPSSALREGETTLTLRNRTEGAAVISYMQDMYLEYTRHLVARDGQLGFPSAGGVRNMAVDGVGVEGVRVWDVSDSWHPVALEGVTSVDGEVTFGDVREEGASLLVCAASAVQELSHLEAVDFRSLTDPDSLGNYLIITSRGMAEPADRLAAHRAAEGFTVQRVFVDEVYDQFGYGLKDEAAIRQFVGYAYHHGPRPGAQYVALIGDASYDPRNRLGYNLTEHVPTHMGPASFSWAAEDMWFGCVDGEDTLADVALGRIATDDPAVLHAVVDKIMAYEAAAPQASWRREAVWVADARDSAGDFKARSEELKARYFDPAGVVSTLAYREDHTGSAVHDILLRALYRGVGHVNYLGHGLLSRLGANDSYLSVAEIPGLENAVHPVVSIFACQAGQFQGGNFDPRHESLSEALVEQSAGAVASIAATTEALELISAQIAHGYFNAVFHEKTYRLGDALRAGFEQLHAYNYSSPEMLFYTLFGDPALIINPVADTTADRDGDGMSDGWERAQGLEPHRPDGAADPDADGWTNREEFEAGTNPRRADSDGDGLLDSWESGVGADPVRADSDADSLPDGWEVLHGLKVLLSDQHLDPDGDGLLNADEFAAGTHPQQADSDFDGVSDGDEVHRYFSDPLNGPEPPEAPSLQHRMEEEDRDGDRLPDHYERTHGLHPDQADGERDPDEDGLNNVREYLLGTLPQSADSDADGLNDGQEVLVWGSDPLQADTDQDGLLDGAECEQHQTHPLVVDSDGDGVRDGEEVAVGMNPLEQDTDGDGLPDGWEWPNGGDPLVDDRLEDDDGDGLVNADEYQLGTLPQEADTDEDGLGDGDEVHRYHTFPFFLDSDGDGASDRLEIEIAGTDPRQRDSDGDGMEDGWEIRYGLDPRSPDHLEDSDGDGVQNAEEHQYALDPFSSDSDGDGLTDRVEIDEGFPGHVADGDQDGLSDGQEVALGTDPRSEDTDGDQLSDGLEVNHYGTNPLLGDSDGDGLSDAVEVAAGTLPGVADVAADPDGDGLSNGEELTRGTHPLERDSDGDGLEDHDEIYLYHTHPLQPDSDADGLNDAVELHDLKTDPVRADTDGDRMPDGWEVLHGLDPVTRDHRNDPDGDGLANGEEFRWHTHPRQEDSDGDGLGDLFELLAELDPTRRDSDGDGMDDAWEWAYGGALIAEEDRDADGLTNQQEFEGDSHPFRADTDGDRMSDAAERQAGTDPNDVGSVLAVRTELDGPGLLCLRWSSVTGRTYRVVAVPELHRPDHTQIIRQGVVATPPENYLCLPLAAQQSIRVELE